MKNWGSMHPLSFMMVTWPREDNNSDCDYKVSVELFGQTSAYEDIRVQLCTRSAPKEQPNKSYNETLNSTDLSADKLNIEQIPECEIHPMFIWAENECNSVVSTQGMVLGSPEFDLENERDEDESVPVVDLHGKMQTEGLFLLTSNYMFEDGICQALDLDGNSQRDNAENKSLKRIGADYID